MGNTDKEVSERLRKILQKEMDNLPEEIGNKQNFLADKIGIKQPYLSQILNGKRLGVRSVIDICDALGVGVGKIFQDFGMPPASPDNPVREHGPIPLLKWHEINNGVISKRGGNLYSRYPVSQKTFALEVKSDSMSPRYLPGDIVIVDPDEAPESGDRAIVKVGEEYCLKIIQYSKKGDIVLACTNDKYADLTLTGKQKDKIKIAGKVVDMIPKM